MRMARILRMAAVSVLLAAGAGVSAQEPTPSEEAALKAYREGAFSRAVQLYTAALSEATTATHRARLHVRIGWTMFALGREAEVDTHLKAALLEDPNLELVPDYYTREFLERFEAARRSLLDAQRTPADVPPADLEATVASVEQRLDSATDLEGALVDVDRLLATYPGDERLPPLRTRILAALGRGDRIPSIQPTPSPSQSATGAGADLNALSIPDLILRANRMLDEGDVDTSLELLREAVARQPSNVAALELMAEAARRAARWQEAEFALKSALGLQPDNIGLQLRLGEVSLAMGDASAARDVFYQLTVRYPHSDRAWAALGLLDAHLGNRDQALEELASALAENPLLPEVQLAQGELLLASGQADEALPVLRAAANLLHDDPQVQARIGQALLARGEAADALEQLRRARESGFAPPDVARALVLAMIEQGLLSEADRTLDESSGSTPETAILEAMLRLSRGDLDAAEQALQPAIAAHPGSPGVLNLLTVIYFRKGRYEEAVKVAEHAHDLVPDNPTLVANLAHARAAYEAQVLGEYARPVRYGPAR